MTHQVCRPAVSRSPCRPQSLHDTFAPMRVMRFTSAAISSGSMQRSCHGRTWHENPAPLLSKGGYKCFESAPPISRHAQCAHLWLARVWFPLDAPCSERAVCAREAARQGAPAPPPPHSRVAAMKLP